MNQCRCGQSFSSLPHYCTLVDRINAAVGASAELETPSTASPAKPSNKMLKSGTTPTAGTGLHSPGPGRDDAFLDDELDVGKSENIKVVVRVRPLMDFEKNRGGGAPVVHLDPPDGRSLAVTGSEARHQLRVKFDACFGEGSTQEQLYAHVRDCAKSVVDGFNSTVFAYGQTGTGKVRSSLADPHGRSCIHSKITVLGTCFLILLLLFFNTSTLRNGSWSHGN